MNTPNVHKIYCWKAQDIPEPDPEDACIDTGVPLDGKAIVKEAMDRLLDNLDAEFFVAPHEGSTKYNTTSEIRKIDREVGRIRSVMLAVKHELGRRVSLLSKHRNSIVPFGKLPIELVGAMLTHATSITSYYRRTHKYTPVSNLKELATVSVGWWHAIRSSPAVWTTLGPEPDQAILLKIRKSGTLPLHFVTLPFLHNHTKLIESLASNHERWKSIHLNLQSMEGLEAAREYLRGSLPRLESLTLALGDMYSGQRHLELGEGRMLWHLDLEGIMPHIDAPGLRSITHLTLTEITDVCAADIHAILERTISIESLYIQNLADPFREPLDPTGPSRRIEIPTLKRLILDSAGPILHAELLDGIRTNHLSYLYIKREPTHREMEATILLQLIRPNGQAHGSILSTVIANSSTKTIYMSTEDNSTLQLTGLKSNKDIAFHIHISNFQWHPADKLEQLSAFASSIPPVRLSFKGSKIHQDDAIHSLSSLSFIRFMPSIVSISIKCPGDLPERLFRDFLADEYQVEQDRRWICPMLNDVWIGRKAQDQDCRSTICEALKRRSEAVRDKPLPRISILYEEDGHWTEQSFDSLLVDSR